MAITFTKLPEPITINDPVKVTFTEYHVYDDVVLHIAESTISSVYIGGLTPDSFVLREILQNAIDSEILKTGDFIGSYKKVKLQNVGKWHLVESEGTLDEDIFLIGFSTKKETKETFCRLIGRFGVGLKESIFVLLYQGAHILMAFNDHVYGFGYYYKGKVYYDIDLRTIIAESNTIKPVILRGEYNVKDKVLVYIPVIVQSAIPILYPYEKPYAVDPRDFGLVYHNGLYSGKWQIPLDVNLCNVNTDQYRAYVFFDDVLINALEMIVDDRMPDAFKEILLRYVVKQGRVFRFATSFWFDYLFDNAKEKLSSVLQKALNLAVEELMTMIGEKVIVVDRYNKITSFELPAVALPDIKEKYINGVRSYLASKGFKVFAYSEALSGKLVELYNEISEPNVPDRVKSLIKLGEWLYSIGVELMERYNIPGWLERMNKIGSRAFELLDPIPGIFDIEVRVIKHEYNDLLTDSVGVTLIVNNKPVIILRNLPEDEWLLYVGVTLHELNHIYSEFGHGSYQWENIYNVLYMVDVLDPVVTPYISNLIRLAVYNPKLFLKINNIKELPPYILPRALIEDGECNGYVDNRGVVCEATSPTTLRLINDNGILKLQVVP